MKVIIQAGGEGTRLRPITYEIPKPLIPVKKRPVVGHIIDMLQKNGVEDIAMIVSEKHARDFDMWKAGETEDIRKKILIIIEPKQSGTFGWIRNLKDWIADETFAVINGDTLLDTDVGKLKEFHDSHGKIGTLLLTRVPDPKHYGVIILDEKGGVVNFLYHPEHSPSNYISAGFHIFTSDVFKYETEDDVMMIDDHLLPALIKEKELIGIYIEGTRCYDCGTLERWEKAIKEW